MSEESRVRLTEGRVRNLSVEALMLQPPVSVAGGGSVGGARSGVIGPGGGAGGNEDDLTPLPEDDPLLHRISELLERFGGVIFTGPPGTSKSWFAARAALALAGSSARVRFVQFHASYQYEDFVQGYVPNEDGKGFSLASKHLLQLAEDAASEPNLLHVLVIDELSRGDAARIFGEGLTYVEKTKRGLSFSLASGDECSIPPNLIFLATMNALDRGVDEVDAAFERRFAKIAMDPSDAILEQFLTDSGMAADLRAKVLAFFRFVNEQARDNPPAALGHTFFLNAKTEDDLKRLWDHQLRFFFEKAYRLDPQGHREVRTQWEGIFAPVAAGGATTPGDATGA